MSPIPSKYSRKVEDYLETILMLIEQKGFAQTKDIAEALNVKPPSVTEMLDKLKKEALVEYEKYSPIILTEKGKESAKRVFEKHKTIKKLLKFLKIPENVADKDACVMEHGLHSETINQLKNYVNFIESSPEAEDWLKSFEIFCKEHK